jgi:hypothetical protein
MAARIDPYRRATVVLPVPGGPAKAAYAAPEAQPARTGACGEQLAAAQGDQLAVRRDRAHAEPVGQPGGERRRPGRVGAAGAGGDEPQFRSRRRVGIQPPAQLVQETVVERVRRPHRGGADHDRRTSGFGREHRGEPHGCGLGVQGTDHERPIGPLDHDRAAISTGRHPSLLPP